MAQVALEKLANDLGIALKKLELKLAVAESCTGGGVCYAITTTPGSSDWFDRGFITYSNQAKIDMLGVDANTLSQFGAVSKEVAIAMAEGALARGNADISVAITGIAGPDGGTQDKPVGTVWIAWARNDTKTNAALYHLDGDRHAVREHTIVEALTGLLITACIGTR